ncbi:MAG TPA: HD domain-containing phosphohydrolase [Longimicrobium sp.]|nr:HD domain-containing phosphohydrolase [Longimicrobium sp.]
MNESVVDLLAAASAQERAGQWSQAIETYQHAFRTGLAEGDPVVLLEVLVKQGHCYRDAGHTEVATDLLHLAVHVSEQHGMYSVSGRALNGIAIVLQQAGDLPGAEETYLRAREFCLRAGDERVLGEIEQNRGILDNIRGDLDAAYEHYMAGLEHLERGGHERGVAFALNNLGMLNVDRGNLEDAERFFQRALEIVDRVGDVVTAGAIHINRAELFLALGQPHRARASCDEGFEIASRLGDDSRRAEALKFYGVIYRMTGKLHLAEIHLRQAVEIAVNRQPLLEAETQRELALVLRGMERNREALAALNRSHALFTSLQARSDEAEIGRRIAQLEEDFLALVRSWGESIEAKDRYTRGHCERVAEYACRLAERVGMSENDIVWFRMGAFLHDLGKTEVPAEILNKPGKLTDEERAVMERHPVTGYEMLGSVEFPWDIRPMVRWHHERWDGRGYPDRLAGGDIHLSARILRIADVYDALTTARSYREPLSPEKAFSIMEEDEGSFDPEVFALFREMFPGLREFTLAWRESEGAAEPQPAALTRP